MPRPKYPTDPVSCALTTLRIHDPELYQACQRVLERRNPGAPVVMGPSDPDLPERAHCVAGPYPEHEREAPG